MLRTLIAVAAVLLLWITVAAGVALREGTAQPGDGSLQIIEQPQDATIECAGVPVTFSVTASGSELGYQWFGNDVPLAGQTGPVLHFPVTTTTMDGSFYYVVITNSNSLASITSRIALLRVHPDTCGPTLLKAVSLDWQANNSNRVLLTFDEPLAFDSAVNPGNYRVSLVGQTNVIPAINAIRVTSQVRLTLNTNLYRTNDYLLTVTGLRDALSNNIAPETQVPILFAYSNQVFGMAQPWTYYDSVPGCEAVDSTWISPAYLEGNLWGGPEPGIFWKFGSILPPAPCSGTYAEYSQLSSGCTTHYFRTRFTISDTPIAGATLNLQHFIDDGAVFYLNGAELARYNMPTGVVTSGTLALMNAPVQCAVTVAVASNLLAGENLLAVEVHQASGDNQNVVFGVNLALFQEIGPHLPTPDAPTLAIATSGANVILSWAPSAPGFRLEHAATLAGPWREAQPLMSNPWRVAAANKQTFYRLRWVER